MPLEPAPIPAARLAEIETRARLDAAQVAILRVNPPNAAQTRMLCDDHDAMRAEIRSLARRLGEAEHKVAGLQAGRVVLVQERDADRALIANLVLQAQGWAMEARCHKSTVHEAYQAVTGATGEPGNWHGAKPIVDALQELLGALAAERAGRADMAASLERVIEIAARNEASPDIDHARRVLAGYRAGQASGEGAHG